MSASDRAANEARLERLARARSGAPVTLPVVERARVIPTDDARARISAPVGAIGAKARAAEIGRAHEARAAARAMAAPNLDTARDAAPEGARAIVMRAALGTGWRSASGVEASRGRIGATREARRADEAACVASERAHAALAPVREAESRGVYLYGRRSLGDDEHGPSARQAGAALMVAGYRAVMDGAEDDAARHERAAVAARARACIYRHGGR